MKNIFSNSSINHELMLVFAIMSHNYYDETAKQIFEENYSNSEEVYKLYIHYKDMNGI